MGRIAPAVTALTHTYRCPSGDGSESFGIHAG